MLACVCKRITHGDGHSCTQPHSHTPDVFHEEVCECEGLREEEEEVPLRHVAQEFGHEEGGIVLAPAPVQPVVPCGGHTRTHKSQKITYMCVCGSGRVCVCVCTSVCVRRETHA